MECAPAPERAERAADAAGRTCSSPLLLVTELFPPAVGGSAVLYENVYSRLCCPGVHVLTDPVTSAVPEGPGDPFSIIHTTLRTRQWGLLNLAGTAHHWRTAGEIRRIGRERGAIVHCGRALPEGVAAWISRLRGGPKYVCWAHGEDVATARTSRELTFVTSRVFSAASGVLANSRNTARELESLGVDGARIRVAYPGVDSARFRPEVDGSAVRARHAKDGELMLLTVGRLQRRKGHDLVIRAMAELAARPELRYVIVGGGEEEETLRTLARACGVADRVDFAGKIPDEELPAYYAACDVFLMPNRADGADIEGFGIVFLEAQATERPVIAGRTGGAPEAVAEGETALLVGGDDPSELARALDELAGSPELRARFGRAGRERAAGLFTWNDTARAVAALQRELEGSR